MMWGVQEEYTQGFQIIICIFFPAFLLFLISSLYLPQWCHYNCSGFFVYNKNSAKKPLIFAFQECQSNFLRLFLNPCTYFSRRFLSNSIHSRIWGEHDSAVCVNLGKLKFVKNGKNMKNVFWVKIWVIMYVCTHIIYIWTCKIHSWLQRVFIFCVL